MTRRPPKDVGASVRQLLLNIARQRNTEFQRLLVRYAIERLLYRLSLSPHRDRFMLKGAMLFELWTEEPHRWTRDLDLWGRGHADTDRVAGIFREVCSQAVDDDGLAFDASSVEAIEIREGHQIHIHAAPHTDPGGRTVRAVVGIPRGLRSPGTVAGVPAANVRRPRYLLGRCHRNAEDLCDPARFGRRHRRQLHVAMATGRALAVTSSFIPLRRRLDRPRDD